MKPQTLLTQTNFSKLKDEVKKNKDKTLIFSGNDDGLNRKVLEKLHIQILLINLARRKDRMKQRDSGLNQVLAKLAKKNNIVIGINLDEIIKSEKKQKAEIISRVRQNIKLCNKYKVRMKFISIKEKKDSYDVKALGLVLGMPTWMVKEL